MRSLFTIAVGGWLVLAVASCAKTTDDAGLGTNTNWLKSCEASSDCEGDAQCICGQCTVPCADSADCGGVNAEASCEQVDEAACGAAVGSTSACLQGCRSNDDCTAVAEGRCVSGLCVPEPPVPADAGGPDSGNLDPLALRRQGAVIVIPDAYRPCEGHVDCVLVEHECSSCCGLESIRSSLLETFQERMPPACQGYNGGSCDCEYTDKVPRCVEGQCRAVERDQTECFGPEGDLEQAGAPDAIGCSCHRLDLRSCAGSVTLECVASHYGVGWTPVDDALCSEPPPEPCSTPRDLADCATSGADVCYLQPGGGYCGISMSFGNGP